MINNLGNRESTTQTLAPSGSVSMAQVRVRCRHVGYRDSLNCTSPTCPGREANKIAFIACKIL
jgi:hypothetical protein